MPEIKEVPAVDEVSKIEPVVEEPTEQIIEEPKSEYQEELERIESEKKALEEKHQTELEEVRADKERVLTIQQKAIDAEKAKTSGTKDKWREETLREVDRKLDLRDARVMVQGMTDDPVAEKVILHHFENLPQELRTGTIKEQLLTAQALSLRNRLPSLLNNESMNDQANSRSIASMGGGNLPGRSSFQGSGPSPTARTAAQLVQAFAGNDKDRAKKLTERITGKN